MGLGLKGGFMERVELDEGDVKVGGEDRMMFVKGV